MVLFLPCIFVIVLYVGGYVMFGAIAFLYRLKEHIQKHSFCYMLKNTLDNETDFWSTNLIPNNHDIKMKKAI